MQNGADHGWHDLTVRYGGRDLTVLTPGCEPFTFGRSPTCSLTVGTDPAPDGGLHVSALTGSVQWADGAWHIRNESGSRPFDVLVGGEVRSLHPRAGWTDPGTFVVGTEPVRARIFDPAQPGPHLITFAPGWRPRLEPVAVPPVDERTAPPEGRRLELRSRRILAVKFLSGQVPGHAVDGNQSVADRVTALDPHGQPVTAQAVANLVSRCREYLRSRGVPDPRSPDALGVQLLHWGVIRVSDRALLRPSLPIAEASDLVRPVAPEDIGVCCAVFGGLAGDDADPVLERTVPHAMHNGRSTADVVRVVADTLLPLGACLAAADRAVALVRPPPPLPRPAERDLLHRLGCLVGRQLHPLWSALFGLSDPVLAYRIWGLGVADVDRGHGLGRALIDAVTGRCDREGHPAVMTVVESGPLHELCRRKGFVPAGHVAVPEGPALLQVWRDPVRT